MAYITDAIQSLLFISTCMITYCQVIFAEVLPPHNITISNILDSSALISWDVHANNDDVKAFGLLHSKIGGNSKTITDLDKGFLSYALLDLHPSTEYLVYMWAVSEDGESVPSETRQFTTESTSEDDYSYAADYNRGPPFENRSMTTEEVIILLGVMSMWLVTIAISVRSVRAKMTPATAFIDKNIGYKPN